jgi:fermentation-respiration switch protein FrsA (DUF1100 family)
MSVLLWIALLGLAGYIVGVAALYVFQRSLLYLPQPKPVSPAAAALPEAEEVVLDTTDGERVIAWYVPPDPGRPIVIYFHGNAETIAKRAARHRELIAGGTGLLALSYRGYMGSTGRPTEAGLLRDAEAAYQFVASRYPPDRIVLWGHSLGSGVAVALAATRPVAKLVLEAPFSSAVDVAQSMFPIVPVRRLMHDQFRSDQRIGDVRASLLVLHGERDRVVPIALGERLFELAPAPKRFVRYAAGGHDDLDSHGGGEEARRFIAEPSLAEVARPACGLIDSEVRDLASDPEHLRGFGRDAGHR